MSYSESNGQVTLTMSHKDYELLMIALGRAAGSVLRNEGVEAMRDQLRFVDRLNQGNPRYRPYLAEKTSCA